MPTASLTASPSPTPRWREKLTAWLDALPLVRAKGHTGTHRLQLVGSTLIEAATTRRTVSSPKAKWIEEVEEALT